MHRLARTKAGRLSAVGSLLAALIALVALPTGASSASPTAEDKGHIQPELLAEFEKAVDETQEFWVILDSSADTSSASGVGDWDKRGQAVYDALRSHAKTSQAEVIAQLDAAGATYTSYWITNAVHVEAGTYALASSLAGATGVETVRAPVTYEQVEPIDKELTTNKMGPDADAAVEWGVANIKADQVWDTYGIRGDGIVVGSIDTGVQYDHPALIHSYRGYRADGTVSHDYNWLDVTGASTLPVDGGGHGTHTMGTMTGDDGAANRIGVAPGATWISANGCCPSDAALLDSAQWMLAPTKVDGTRPDPAQRPNIINNSWGTRTPSNDPFMEDVLQAWADSGIFGVWANGNIGPGCDTSGAPGSRTINYSVGNYDINDTIAPSSSRGSGQDGEIKPNISAPGTNVRSAYPGSSYASMTGTSMAAPHTAAAVALLYNADPSLIGDLAATREALDGTARDTADDQCGGTADDNNVYGEGRLDALALVESALEQSTSGSLTGTVTDAERQVPVTGATITLTSGELVRSTRQGESGGYALTLPVGEYTVRVAAFGYEPSTTTVTVTDGETTTHDVTLTPLPGGTVSGRVVDPVTGAGIPEAVVTLAGVPFVGTTDATGAFAINKVPGPKKYVLSVNAGLCGARLVTRSVDMGGTDAVVPTIAMPRHPLDVPYGTSYGYSCVTETSDWTPGDTLLVLAPMDASGTRPVTEVDLPFPFRFHGRALDSIGVHAPGRGPGTMGASVSFCLDEPRWNAWTPDAPCPSSSALTLDTSLIPLSPENGGGQVFTAVKGTAPNRTFTIEWRDYTYFGTDADFDLGLTLHENGDIVIAGHDIDPDSLFDRAGAAGRPLVSSSIGGPALMHCCTWDQLHAVGNESGGWPWRSDATQVRIDLPDAGTVAGVVTDAATGDPIADAVVQVRAPDGAVQWQVHTDGAGRYKTEIFTGHGYTVAAYKPRTYGRGTPVDVRIGAPGATAHADFKLAGAKPTVTLDADTSGQTATLRNNGDKAYEWTAALDVPVASPAEAGSLTKVTDLNATKAPVAVEEGGGSWWVAQAHLVAANPQHEIREYTTDGDPTGTVIAMSAIANEIGVDPSWLIPYDLVYVDATNEVCFIVAGDSGAGGFDATQPFNDIVCADARDGGYSRVIRTDIPDFHLAWGLAYDETHDRLFLQHWHKDDDRFASGEALGIRLTTMAGPNSPQAGTQLTSCTLYGVQGLGMAYQPGSDSMWKMERSGSRTPILSQIDPTTCTETGWRRADNPPAGLPRGTDIRPDGTLLAASLTGDILEFATGDDDVPSLPWLKLSQNRGTIAPGGTATIDVRVDETRIPEGVDHVDLVLSGNGGEQSKIRVPIRLRESQQTDTTLSLSATPTQVKVGGSTKVKVKVNTTSGVTPTGQVTVTPPGGKTVRANLVDGSAVLAVGPLTSAGRIALAARYLGDAWNRASSRSLSLTVVAKPRLRLTTRVVTLKRASAYVGLRCAGTAGTCAGTLVIKKGGNPVARGSVSLRAGTARTVKLPLNARGRALLRKGRRVTAVLVVPNPSGTSQVSITLRPVR
ncbi:S8 family serine peptidase [Nocardioides sp. Root140]|uniref:S8 family serine peptidase n=2 Tax=unclassified Nocardioides TaxID=2615069 RepID=UPI0006F50091|nr:S8 family serine peptidase [Nocardioides sp. Root140]KQY56444.1 hypothetical protein ASD30_08870 [Nocardioides sp. Root140]